MTYLIFRLPAYLPACLMLVLCSFSYWPHPVSAADELNVEILYLARDVEPPLPLSLIDERIDNNGLPGAQLGLQDNQTTGSFLGQKYALTEWIVPEEGTLLDTVQDRLSEVTAPSLILANLDAADLLAAADAMPNALIFNVRAGDDALRNEDCRANVFHITPSRSMLTDGLAQYLTWKRWSKVVLITGRHPQDALYGSAMRRSIKRFGLKMVDEKDWTAVPGARRTDSGHHSAQAEIPVFTDFKNHDVVLVADEGDEFGEYLPYRTRQPRPIAGTQGLTPTSWHRAHEQWGATQIQRRFNKLAGRDMSTLDYAAWAAMRSIGEAVTNTNSFAAPVVREFLLSDKFKLAGFKGLPLTFRRWNGQLRQSVLIVAPRMLVSVSPQDGFLHQLSELDTLGFDEPESACQVFKQ